MSCRIKESGTHGRQAFIDFLKKAQLFKDYTDTHLKLIVKRFFEAMHIALYNKLPIDLGTVGHLVVEPITRESVSHSFSDSGISITPCRGCTARLRKASPQSSVIIDKEWYATLCCRLPEELIASIVNDVSEHDAKILFMEWRVFLRTALRELYRVEIRGIGAFNVHQRKEGKVYNRHGRSMVNAQGSIYFKFKPAVSLKTKLREISCK